MPFRILLDRLAGLCALTVTLFASSASFAVDLVDEDFTGFAGAGLDTPPAAGQLDSASWRVLGLSDGDSAFDGTYASGDYARGAATGGVSTGGAYAFDVGGGDIALGVQPGGSDFTPGSFDLRIENTTGSTITDLDVSYDLYVYNDQPRANSLNVAFSTDGTTFTPVGGLDFTSPEAADPAPAWSSVAQSTSLTGLSLADGAFLYLRFAGDDVSGSGSRDEFAIDNLLVATPGGGLSIVKTGAETVEPGENLIYDIAVSNTSTTDPVTGLTVTDTLPAAVTYVSDTSGVTPTNPSAGVYEWSLADLGAQDSASFTLTVAVDAGASGTLTNQAEASGTLLAAPVTDSDSHDTTVLAPLSIHEVQGEGLASPVAGSFVALDDNIVTAVGPEGFFLQMPDARSSNDLPLASRGIYVYTGGAPTVSVGDRLTLSGDVVEFFDFTEITNPVDIQVLASGESLPAAIALSANFPSRDPDSPSCGINNFECFEGMRVNISNGFVTAPTQSFGSDPVAEAVITASGQRALREPGVEYPGLGGTCPNCAVFDGNPEVFEIDFDKLGQPNATVAAGARFTANGVIGFEFGDYEVWPTGYNLTDEPVLPSTAPATDTDQVTMASLNALNLFNDIDDPQRAIPTCGAGYIADDREVLNAADYELKLDKIAQTVIGRLGLPDVVALQEVESTVVLDDLSARIDTLTTGAVVYDVYLTPGNDRGEINNGYLVNPARVAVDGVTQIDPAACLSSDNTPLHDRPSQELQARFIAGGANWPFVVINNHLRSLGGIDTARTRLKRHEQSQSVAARIQALQSGDPTLPIVVTGDLNAFQFSDGYVDVVGLLTGTSVEDANLVNIENSGVPGFDPTNQVDPALIKPIDSLAVGERYSFIFQGHSQALDHALISQSAQPFLVGFGYARGNADVWEDFAADSGNALRSSDHDGLIVVLDPAGIPDDVFSDRFEGN